MTVFYRETFQKHSRFLSATIVVTSTIMSRFLWFNKSIMIDSNSISFSNISDKGINQAGQLFKTNCKKKKKNWDEIWTELSLQKNTYFSWLQLVNALPCSWKRNILKVRGSSTDFCVYENHLIKSSKGYKINKRNSKELYIIQHIKISQTYFTVILRINFPNKIRPEKI